MIAAFPRAVLAAVLVALLGSAPSQACGPFCGKSEPSDDVLACLQGNLGDFTTHSRECRAIGFLVLRGLSPADQRLLVRELTPLPEPETYPPPGPDAVWMAARAKVPGLPVPPAQPLDTEKSFPDGDGGRFANCLTPAFELAAKTLQARVAEFGEGSPEVVAWVAAQDQVFQNCGGTQSEPVLPEPAPEDASAKLRADRAYQMAAALFYAGEFDRSVQALDSIAKDASSPWRRWARLVAVRALIRKATLNNLTDMLTPALSEGLEQARQRAAAILTNPSLKTIHPEARKLLWRIDFRVRPEQQLGVLGQVLLEKPDALFGQAWADYFRIWRGRTAAQYWDTDWCCEQGEQLRVAPLRDELSLFIETFDKPDTYPQALEWWKKTHSLPWLVAALSREPLEAPELPELLAAAEAVPPESPATVPLQVYRARLAVEDGRWDEVRERVLPLLEKRAATLPPKTVATLGEYLINGAQSFEEWARYAHLTPDAAATFFSEAVPLSRFSDAKMLAALDPRMRKEVVLAGWTRAVLLERWEDEKALEPHLAALAEALTDDLDRVKARAEPEARKLAAVVLLLRAPGMSPYVRPYRAEFPRSYDLCGPDGWCPQGPVTYVGDCADGMRPCAPRFLTPEERQSALKESRALPELGSAPELLMRFVLDSAKQHPDGPLVPEALARCVTTARYTHSVCGSYDEAKKVRRELAKQAFQLLHRKYPRSRWAQETPVYYR
jgi:hypothetical protein